MSQDYSARAEQIVSQLHIKTLHAVLAARVPALHYRSSAAAQQLQQKQLHQDSSSSRARKRDRWFNLALGELPPALEHHHHAFMDPTVIDIILFPLDSSVSPAPRPESVIERWCVQCEAVSTALPSHSRAMADNSPLYRRTYKKSIVLLRAVYSMLRLLPAHRVFQMLSTSNQSYNYDISYRIASFAEPFSRVEEAEFKVYSFSPIETQFGQLTVSVTYRPDLSEFNHEVLPPVIIADYVGSPAADPLRQFPSSPTEKGTRPISLQPRGVRVPAPPPLSRPHSWTSASMRNQLSTSPSSDPRLSPVDVYRQQLQGQRIPVHRRSSFGLEDYHLSPPLSLSPSPSPPTHSTNFLQSRLCLETKPVSIPSPVTGKGLQYHTPNYSAPTRVHLRPPSPTRSLQIDHSMQESPSQSRSFRKSEGMKLADVYSNLQSLKLKDGRDDSGRFFGALSSGSSPKVGFSRSSSRLSVQDDLDDADFYPFAVDDVDTADSQNRKLDGKDASDSAQASSHRSQDAAVGMLVHVLKTATPLHQDSSSFSQSSRSDPHADVNSSSFFRKASDALEELRNYKEMKDSLLSQSGTRLSDSANRRRK